MCPRSDVSRSERVSFLHHFVALPLSPSLTPLSFLHNTYGFIIHPFMYYCLLFDADLSLIMGELYP